MNLSAGWIGIGAASALLPTTAGGRPLEDGRYDELFRTAEKLGILFFLHPVSPEPAARFSVYTLQVLVQWPFETTLAVSRMIFDGFFDHFPALKILVAHRRGWPCVSEGTAQFGLRGPRR